MNPLAGSRASAAILGLCLALGLVALGAMLAGAVKDFKQYERSVKVKGLSEREYPADVVIWPIQYTVASNKLADLYEGLDNNAAAVRAFLLERGLRPEDISLSAPAITDKSAQRHSGGGQAEFRYTAEQSVTVYSQNVELVR